MRRLSILATLFLLTILAAIVLIPPVHAVQAAKVPNKVVDPNPEGVWAVTVKFPDGTQEHALALFLQGGGYIETNTKFPASGLGSWKQTSPTAFEAIFIKQLRSDQGVYLGSLHIHLVARFLSPTHYVGQGEGLMYDAGGHLVGSPSHTSNDALRIPSTDPHWLL